METNDNFIIIEIDGNKKQYLPLLLIGDESESMIDRYLDYGTLFVGFFKVLWLFLFASYSKLLH